MKLIHVHGFSELKHESLITLQYKKYSQKLNCNLEIEEFKWNTLENNPTKLVANFIESDKRVLEAAHRLSDYLQSTQEDFILSGHSLGAAIVLEALKLFSSFQNLHSIILLGAAYPQDRNLSFLYKVKPKYYALNYYSPRWDLTLNTVYYNAKGKTAVGSFGFINPYTFQNLKVNCTHSKRMGYSRIIDGVIDLIAHAQGICSSDRASNYWMPLSIGTTGDWDDIYKTDDHIIQRNCLTTTFRVIESGGIYKKIFQSKSVIPLLNSIQNMPK